MTNILMAGKWIPEDLAVKINAFNPRSQLGKIVKEILFDARITAEQADELLMRISSALVYESKLYLVVFRDPSSPFWTGQRIEDYGLVSERVVTTAGVNYLATQIKNAAVPAIESFHGIGTGTTAEANGDTALVTEWAGSDYTGGVRATGTLTNSSANVVQSVATNTKASAGTSAITEHGCFTANATGTLWDRSVFTAVNLAQNDSLQSTYQGTFAAGG
jgi:hypothetical protein